MQKKYVCKNVCWIWNSATCSCKNDRYTGSIIKDSMIKTVPTKKVPKNFDEKKMICRMKNLYILLPFY